MSLRLERWVYYLLTLHWLQTSDTFISWLMPTEPGSMYRFLSECFLLLLLISTPVSESVQYDYFLTVRGVSAASGGFVQHFRFEDVPQERQRDFCGVLLKPYMSSCPIRAGRGPVNLTVTLTERNSEADRRTGEKLAWHCPGSSLT